MPNTRRRAFLALTTAGMLAISAGSALAAPGDMTASFTGGALTGEAGVVNAAAALTGVQQTIVPTSTPWSVVDATGDGAGWSGTVAASDLTDGLLTIAKSAISISTAAPAPEGTSDTTAFTGVQTALAALTGTVSLFTAPGPNTGTYSFTPAFSLVVPANAGAGSYTGTLTYTLTPAA